MARIERTEYETVEKSVEVTVCDCCNVETDNTVQLSLNPEEKRETTYEITELKEHPEDLELYDEVAYRWGEVGRVCENVEYDLYEGPWDPHWATQKNETTTLVGATETFDVCIECLREQLGADIPDNYESVEIDSDGLTVEKEMKNPLRMIADSIWNQDEAWQMYCLIFGGFLIGFAVTHLVVL